MKNILFSAVVLSAALTGYTAENDPAAPNQNQPSIAVPVNDPDDQGYVVQTGTGYDGVVELYIGDGSGTGALLTTGRHILTAAHLWDGGFQDIDPEEITIAFQLPSGDEYYIASSYVIHPEYDEEEFDTNNDIAIIELSEEAPSGADRYEIYRGNDEVGKVSIKVGFGYHGTGNTGQDDSEDFSVKRIGQNRYDALGDAMNDFFFTEIRPEAQLIYDFDNGNAANDASGEYLGVVDLGLGELEVNTTSGDSGGPSFINFQIAGVTSYGISPSDLLFEPSTDVDEETNSSFGEFSADTRVSFFADWIDSNVGTTPPASINNFEIY